MNMIEFRWDDERVKVEKQKRNLKIKFLSILEESDNIPSYPHSKIYANTRTVIYRNQPGTDIKRFI